MSYNKYNTRHTGRFNSPNQFASGGESLGHTTPQRKQQPQNLQPVQQAPMAPAPAPIVDIKEDVKMEEDEPLKIEDSSPAKPHWMKTKLPGVKKISNRERRRRQNENLRRLLTPKNALMALNEITHTEQVTNNFKVEPATNNQYYKAANQRSFCADLTIDGVNYKGYGENKLMARNAAAEQALRDMIIKKMNKPVASEGEGSTNGDSGADDEALPMIQLASFALHKLFTEWEFDGHKVPVLRAPPLETTDGSIKSQCTDGGSESGSVGGAGAAAGPGGPAAGGKPPKAVPLNASAMHPCMLLTYLRPHLEYRELAAEGDRPQNMLFTMGVDVDGATYIGKAPNKREARRQAAKAACQTIFGVQFDENAVAGTPVPPPANKGPAPLL